MILIIDNYDSFTYNLYQLVLGLTNESILVVRNDKITLAMVKEMDPKCIILSPGPGHPKDSGVCLDVIKYLGEKNPILGVCLGHQAIAFVFGAMITRAKLPLHGKGRIVLHKNSRLFKDIKSSFIAGRYHSLIVDEKTLPQALVIDAYDENEEVMSLSHKDYPIYGIQFHPESILTPDGEKIMQNFLEIAHVKTVS